MGGIWKGWKSFWGRDPTFLPNEPRPSQGITKENNWGLKFQGERN